MQKQLPRSWAYILCFFFLGVLALGGGVAPAWGQGADDLPNPLKGKVENIPDYEAPDRGDFLDKEIKDAPKATKEVADTMHKTLQKVNQAVEKWGGAYC
jgi:hypothetical protein